MNAGMLVIFLTGTGPNGLKPKRRQHFSMDPSTHSQVMANQFTKTSIYSLQEVLGHVLHFSDPPEQVEAVFKEERSQIEQLALTARRWMTELPTLPKPLIVPAASNEIFIALL